MAEKKAEATATKPAEKGTTAPTNGSTAALAVLTPVSEEEPIQVREALASLKDLKAGVAITSEPYEWAEGEVVRCFLLGKGNIVSQYGDNKGGLVDAVRLLIDDGTAEGVTAVSGDAVIVSSLIEYANRNDGKAYPFEITYLGYVQGKTYEYKKFKISPLF